MTTLPEQAKEALENSTPGPWEENEGQVWATWPDIDDGWRFRHPLADIQQNRGWPRYDDFEGCHGNGSLIAQQEAEHD